MKHRQISKLLLFIVIVLLCVYGLGALYLDMESRSRLRHSCTVVREVVPAEGEPEPPRERKVQFKSMVSSNEIEEERESSLSSSQIDDRRLLKLNIDSSEFLLLMFSRSSMN